MAHEILASLEDINAWLPADKARMSDADDEQFQIDASRIVKSQLAGNFTPATLLGWDEPGSTPSLIRGIAGRLIAAYWYRELYSEDETTIPEYAQALYNEAVQMLKDIRTGVLTVLDDTDNPIEDNALEITSADFIPNNGTFGPIFTIEREFG